MSLGLLASFLAPAVAGWAVAERAWRSAAPAALVAGRPVASRLLVGALALPLGLGLCSCLYFIWLVSAGRPGTGFFVVEAVLLATLLFFTLRRRRSEAMAPARRPAPDSSRTGWVVRVLPAALVATAVVALAGFAFVSLSSPHGAWDAWMTWNLGARFLFRGGTDWTLAFSEILRHPDYPLLLQGAVARAWHYAGEDTVLAPGLIGLVFTTGTVALAWAATAMLRTSSQAHVAGLLLLSTSFLVIHGASQYADVPVGFFFLAALALFWLHDRLPASGAGLVFLAGVAAGLGGWTKNEGLLFLLSLAAARCAAVWPAGGWRRCRAEMGWFTLGAAPVLLVILYFKTQLAPSNYLFSPEEHGLAVTLQRLLDGGRYLFLAGAVKREMLAFGETGMAGPGWLLAAYVLCVGFVGRAASQPALRMAVVAGCLILAGHLLVLLVAPGDMPRLASASLNRLFLQIWPGIVFTSFMVTRAPDEARFESPMTGEGPHDLRAA